MNINTKVLSIGIAVVLALSVFVVPMGIGDRQAFAVVTMDVSTDDHGNRFFNDSFVRVEIEDDSKDDDLTDDIQVDIEVRSDTGTLLFDSEVTVPDTTAGSQTFEFFLVNISSTLAPADADGAPTIFTIGNGGNIDIGEDFREGFTVRVSYGGQTRTIQYDDSSVTVSVDREEYGTGNTLFLTIEDQDGNADPTNRDLINASTAIVAIQGDDAFDPIACLETGRNTAEFECEWLLNATDSGTNVIDIPDTDVVSLVFTVTDASQYMENTAGTTIDAADDDVASANLESGTDAETITIENNDGEIAQVNNPTMGSELILNLDDVDRNLNSKVEDNIIGLFIVNSTVPIDMTLGGSNVCDFDKTDLTDAGNSGLIVYIDAECGDVEVVDMTETGDNAGLFVPDLSNDELKITFLDEADSTPEASNGVLEFTSETIDADIVIAYVDPAADNPLNNLTSSFTRELVRVPGTVDAPETAGINADFTVTLTDADLNNDPRSKDSYTVTFSGTGDANNEFPFLRGGNSIGNEATSTLFATMELEVEGEPANFAVADMTVTFIETGINTGVFAASFDMADLIDSLLVAQQDVDDGDEFEFTYHDYMEVPDSEDSAELSIGRADAGVDFSRDVVPIPPAPGGLVDNALGSDEVSVSILVTDPDSNDNSGSEDQITVVLGTNFDVEVDSEDFEVNIPDDQLAGANFPTKTTSLNGIMADAFDGMVLTETGPNTGVFEQTLTFVRSTLSGQDWQDMTITFTYTDAVGDTESDGITFRGNDAAVQSDTGSVRSGDLITITIQDEDLNLDDEEIEEFDATFDDTDLFFIQAEDDDITNTGSAETFTETGENTGVFTATFEVGTDITITDVSAEDQATNLHFEYAEETASDGDDGDEIELDIPIVTGTGVIRVSPELVGPGTEITVLVIDSDLNEDPNSSDDLSPTDVGDMVEFTTSRDEVEDDSNENPGLDETGPNTGVFEFTIQLVPGDAEDCADETVGPTQTVSGNEAEMGACPGDFISIRYDDTTAGITSALIEVSSWDPEFAADQESYSVGDRATISISDPDANQDPDIADSLRDIHVTSDTDVVGDDFSALETGPDTGVFRLSFTLTGPNQGGGVAVRNGDTVEVEYTDEFPADFVDEEEDKDFVFTFEVGGAAPTPQTTTPSAPVLRDVQNRVVDEVTVGQQVVLSTTIVNNIEEDQPFVALVEVRDDTGVTVFLSWQTGTLTPDGRIDVGISWTPEFAGDYQIRTFVLSNLENPQILSPVASSEVTVS